MRRDRKAAIARPQRWVYTTAQLDTAATTYGYPLTSRTMPGLKERLARVLEEGPPYAIYRGWRAPAHKML